MITTVATWATKRHLADPADSVAVMQRAGITECSIMLNDFSAAREPQEFRTHEPAKVVALARACHDAGIDVTLTTWVMPHRDFIRGMCDQVGELADSTQARGVVLDAEEPWVQAVDRMDFDEAADMIECHGMGALSIGLTAISWASKKALSQLAAMADRWLPQCYAVKGGDTNPRTVVEFGMDNWIERFGRANRWQIALAAYGQPDDPSRFMGLCIDQVVRRGVTAVCYWSLEGLRRPAVADFVASITAKHTPGDGGIFPRLDLVAMPSGTRVRSVEHVQRLLVGWDVDPGPIDGKPGPKTLAAVREFQTKHGLAVTGVVDGGTWWSLLAE